MGEEVLIVVVWRKNKFVHFGQWVLRSVDT